MRLNQMLLLCLLLSAFQARAEGMAWRYGKAEHAEFPLESRPGCLRYALRPMVEVLNEIGEHYRVFFTYDAQLFAGVEVDFELKPEEDLYAAINRLLDGTGFAYNSYSDKYFVLYRNDERGRRGVRKLQRKLQQIQDLESGGDLTLGRNQRQPFRQLESVEESLDQLTPARLLTGTVSNEDRMPLIGANISLPDGHTGAVTDQYGNFQLRLPPGSRQVTISYIGYESINLPVGHRRYLKVQLRPAENQLQEVVVIGYGRTRREDATGSLVAVKESDLDRPGVTATEQLLGGQLAGVRVIKQSGEPGGQINIRIRGNTSINAGNEPLYVIDGLPVDNSPINPSGFQSGRNPLNALNPQDISSVTVLKDASATSIYGARGANGVILIETKKGRAADGIQIDYDGWASASFSTKTLDVLSADDFRAEVATWAPERLYFLGDTTTNWQEKILQTALAQQHTLGISGGDHRQHFRAALGYQDESGIVRRSGLTRLNGTLRYDRQLLNDQLRLDASLKAARLDDQYIPFGVIGGAVYYDPTLPVHDPRSTWGGYYEYDNDQAIRNPVAEVELTQDKSKQYRLLSHLELTYSPSWLKNLEAKLNLGYDHLDGRRRRLLPSILRSQAGSGGELRQADFERTNWLGESYLSYRHAWPGIESKISLTAGYSLQDFANHYTDQRNWRIGLTSTEVETVSIDPGSDYYSLATTIIENRLISFFSRLNYSYKDRYLLTFTLRRDGSSRFGPNNRWGSFPSLALAWRIDQSPVVQQNMPWLSELKLRASWGITGNQEIGDYLYLLTYRYSDQHSRYQFGEEFVTTARPSGVDPNLRWEETESINVGLDFGLWQDRLGGSLEYYRMNTRDLLVSVIVPAGTNLTDMILTNIGRVTNRGLELSLRTRALKRKNLNWDLSGNLAYNKNVLRQLTPHYLATVHGITTGRISGGVGNMIQILREGEPLYAFNVLQHRRDGEGRPLPDNVDFNGDGRIDGLDIYVDTNDDGQVDEFDKVPYGQPDPSFSWGLRSQLQWQRWELVASWYGQLGHYVYNNIAATGANYHRIRTDYVPMNLPQYGIRPVFVRQQYFSDAYVERADFARLDQLSLSYRWRAGRDKDWRYRLSATVNNALLLTAYSGLDPEIGNTGGNPAEPRYGIDDSVYPRARTFVLGLNIEL